MKYDATRVFGPYLTAGMAVTLPDQGWARNGLESLMMLARYAAGEAENMTNFVLPEEPDLRFRNLARLAVLGGAYRLLAREVIHSLKGGDGIPLLRRGDPQWEAFPVETADRYIIPRSTTAAEVSAYAACLPDWLAWQLRQLEPAYAKEYVF